MFLQLKCALNALGMAIFSHCSLTKLLTRALTERINRSALTTKGPIYPATRLAQSSYSKRMFVRMQLCTTSLCTKRASFFAGQIPHPTCSDQTMG